MDPAVLLKQLTANLEQKLTPVEQGHLLGHSFVVDLANPLGAGAQGAVFRGAHIKLELPVAVKVFAADEVSEGPLLARFVREARILAGLHSPNVVRVWDLDFCKPANCYYFVTEFIKGSSLHELIEGLERPLSELEALTTAIATARGLADMHEAGVIHRDFKPGNALWVEGTNYVKVCDLGLAKAAAADDGMGLTVTGETFGTPAYMAPEQARGARDVSPRADVFSLGGILFYLLTGKEPASMSTLQAVLQGKHDNMDQIEADLVSAGVSEATRRLIALMLNKNPEPRPRDGTEALHLLQATMEQLPGWQQVDLTSTLASVDTNEAMAIDHPSDSGIFWEPKPWSDGMDPRFSSTQARMEAEIPPRPGADDSGAKKKRSQETLFWESQFPQLKEEREERESEG